MKTIILYNGEEALVDEEDYKELSRYKWHKHPGGYAVRSNRIGAKTHKIYMHRMILPEVQIIDHINRNKLDNRKQNLRSVNKSLNALNHNLYKTNSSGVSGVRFSRKDGRWFFEMRLNGVRHYFGYKKTKEEAIKDREQFLHKNPELLKGGG